MNEFALGPVHTYLPTLYIKKKHMTKETNDPTWKYTAAQITLWYKKALGNFPHSVYSMNGFIWKLDGVDLLVKDPHSGNSTPHNVHSFADDTLWNAGTFNQL